MRQIIVILAVALSIVILSSCDRESIERLMMVDSFFVSPVSSEDDTVTQVDIPQPQPTATNDDSDSESDGWVPDFTILPLFD